MKHAEENRTPALNAPPEHVVYAFGRFRLDPGRRRLEADGEPVRVTAKAFEALLYLVERSGELVTRSELIEALWPHTVVEDNNLNQAISSLRRVLGEDLIVTVAGRGYQFVADVRTIDTADGRRGVPWTWVAIAGVAIVATAAWLVTPDRAPRSTQPDIQRPITFVVEAPRGSLFRAPPSEPSPILSPDGGRLAFLAPFETRDVIWIQVLGDLEARRLEGTGGALIPFWSPDGHFIGFAADGRLKVIAASGGGGAQDVADLDGYWGGTWSSDGTIVFAATSGLYGTSRDGGEVTPVTRIDPGRGELAHRYPVMLPEPDGSLFMYLVLSSQEEHQGLYLGSLDDPDMKRLIVRADANGALGRDPNGRLHLFFVRDFALLAQPFDVSRGALTGSAAVIARPIEPGPSVRRAAFSVSGRTVAYRPLFRPNTRLVWVDRRGVPGQRLGTAGQRYQRAVLSPDGTKLAVSRLARRTEREDIWWFDLRRGVSERLTHAPVSAMSPVWTPDGSRVIYGSAYGGYWGIYWRPISGPGEESALFIGHDPPQKYPTDVTSDGRFLIFDGTDGTNGDLWLLPLVDEGSPRPLMQTPFREKHGRVSPDGRWLVFTSNETGAQQVYVTSFPEVAKRWRVSTDGGRDPQWRADGKELFYVTADGTLMAASVAADSPFETGPPARLFRFSPDPFSLALSSVYAPAPDGQRFLVNELDDEDKPRLVVMLNWAPARADDDTWH